MNFSKTNHPIEDFEQVLILEAVLKLRMAQFEIIFS
jgi:hypothetical protein